MKLCSSIHFFTSNIESAIEYCTLNIENQKDEYSEIQIYFDRYFCLRGNDLDAIPLHDNDRYFWELFAKKYPTWTPGWVIHQDFTRDRLRLNLYGDIIKNRQGISVYSSRYFGGTEIKSMMSHIICDMSRDLHCPVLSCTFMRLNKESIYKIYAAKGRQCATILCSTLPENNVNVNGNLLYEIFPQLAQSGLLAETDPFVFSQKLCSYLDVIEGGEHYIQQRDAKALYEKTEKLYSIYVRKDAEDRGTVSVNPK